MSTNRPFALPGWALALFYGALVALPLVLAAISDVPPGNAWQEAAAGAGIAGAVMMLLQLVSSGRFRILSERIGIDTTMGFHRWAAPLALALAALHVLALAGPIDLSDPMRSLTRLWRMLNAPGLRDGVIALGLALAMVPLAIWRERLPLPYEAFRALHAAMALGVVGFTLKHILERGSYAFETPSRVFWIALGAGVVLPMLAVYLRHLVDLYRYGWRVAELRPRATRLWELVLESGSGQALRFRAGQFGWLAAVQKRWPIWFDHPFSIASSPRDGRRLRLLIAEAGDFTGKIGTLPIGRRVGFDGPHGNFTADHLQGAEALVMVAGGVGIAPMLGILEDLAERGEKRPVRLIYAARNAEALLDPALLDPPLKALGARAIMLADNPAGREDLRHGPVSEAHLSEALEGLDPARCGALICGPGGMTTAAADGLHALGVPLDLIHYERFDYDEKAGAQKDRQILRRFRLIGAAVLVLAVVFTLR
ncbi:MAG: ferric reductase-like transmembrane domain-containing protein [Pararhodobacter sp.]|nr:ferric reductase-like transmembrane domain-containing protein [Pararhodobacter sp.]